MKKQSNPSSDDPDKVPEFFLDKDKIEKTEDVLEEKEKSETEPAKKNFFKKRSNSDKKSFNTKLAKQETSLTILISIVKNCSVKELIKWLMRNLKKHHEHLK